jgi:hypothetical protein
MYRMNPDRDNIKNYSIWAVVVTEVEVDILTGEMRVVRVDLIEDAGLSTSPQVQNPWPLSSCCSPCPSTLGGNFGIFFC